MKCLQKLESTDLFGDTNRFEAFYRQPRPKLIENRIFLVPTFLWEEDCDGFAYDLFGRVAKEMFCSYVPGLNDAIKILGNNGVA